MANIGRISFWIWVWLALFFGGGAQASTVETEHAEVTLKSDLATIQAGQPFWLALEFRLAEHWHIYWQNPGDSGLAAQLQWDLPQGFAAGPIHWPPPQRIAMEGLMNYGYENQATLLIPVTVPETLEAGQELLIGLNAGWLICHDICIPESGDFMVKVRTGETAAPGENATAIEQALQALPQRAERPDIFRENNGMLEVEATLPPSGAAGADPALREVYFYPKEAGVIRHNAAQRWSQDAATIRLAAERDSLPLPEVLSGVLEVQSDAGTRYYDIRSGDAAVADAAPEKAAQAGSAAAGGQGINLPQALLLAFLGGILLNAMPCVFPVLALKALAISKKAEAAPARVRRQGLAYLGGVALSFLALSAALILLKQSGEILGWGFQLQSPAFVAVMIYLFLLLGLALAGMFELPLLFGGLGGKAAAEDSAKGSFTTGILAVMVATPCTVPFMAPAVGYAFTQSAAVNLLIMLALGVGLAFPYLLISFYPPLLRLLPKPGPWMATFKQFMAFPMFATAAWLLWVLEQQTGAAGLAIMLSVAILLVFLVWLGRGGKHKALLWLIGLGLVAYSSYSLTPHQPMTEMLEQSGYTVEPFSPQKLAELRAQNRPVFVNATAAWCITCKVNEQLALKSATLAKAFRQKGITYMVADWTNYDDAITGFLQQFDRQGVPLYVYYPADGEPQVLPQLLTESIVLEHIQGGD